MTCLVCGKPVKRYVRGCVAVATCGGGTKKERRMRVAECISRIIHGDNLKVLPTLPKAKCIVSTSPTTWA